MRLIISIIASIIQWSIFTKAKTLYFSKLFKMKSLYLSVSLEAVVNCDNIKYHKDADKPYSDFGICTIILDLNHETNVYESLKAGK